MSMPEHSDRSAWGKVAGPAGARGAARLRAAFPIAAVATIVFLVLLAAGQVQPLPAALGVLAIAAGAAVVQRPFGSPEASERADDGSDEGAADMLRRFADALLDPCLILDARANVMHRNGAAAHQFPGVTVGRPLAFSLRHPVVLAAVEAVQRGGAPQSVDLHLTVPTETWHRVSLAPMAAPASGGDEFILVTLQNYTERKRAEAMRQDFVANVSHELRTPLTSLIGFIDTLLGPAAKDTAVRQKFLEIMRGQAERMARLVEDLLSLSRIEMRQHLRPTGTLDLSGLLREVQETLQQVAREAGVTVVSSIPEEPMPVTGDREELFEVFENLLDNAIKYGGSGGQVELALTPVSRPSGFDYLVSVTDHGPGVAAEHVPRLTERFYRVDADTSRKKKGTGLGLAIVKHIVNRHRGQLVIRSQVGEGMRVEVLLGR